MSGVITRRNVDPGDLVALGTPIANVIDMTEVEAEVQIEKEIYQEVISIPQDAVLDKVNKKVVFVIENDRSLERSIELGPLVGEEVIIQKGLAVGKTFVIVGQQSLKNGGRVRIEKTL